MIGRHTNWRNRLKLLFLPIRRPDGGDRKRPMVPPPMKKQKRLKTAADFAPGELPNSFEEMTFFSKVGDACLWSSGPLLLSLILPKITVSHLCPLCCVSRLQNCAVFHVRGGSDQCFLFFLQIKHALKKDVSFENFIRAHKLYEIGMHWPPTPRF